MKEKSIEAINQLCQRFPVLENLRANILDSILVLKQAVENKGTIFVCGNGGSAADAEHIVGELMKSFMHKRHLKGKFCADLNALYPEKSKYLLENLEGCIPAISLVSSVSLQTAYANDVCADMVFAQQMYGLAKENDVLWAISTSGNSKNVNNALCVAKALGCKSIGLSGKSGGEMAELLDVEIRIDSDCTPHIQELHLPIYHCICEVLEIELF